MEYLADRAPYVLSSVSLLEEAVGDATIVEECPAQLRICSHYNISV